MPLYDYACTRCGRIHEVRHGFDEAHEAPCEACGAPLRRVFSAAPVLFKGSGFYVTDSRRSGPSKPEKAKAEPSAEKSSAPDGGSKSGKSESSSGSGASESAA